MRSPAVPVQQHKCVCVSRTNARLKTCQDQLYRAEMMMCLRSHKKATCVNLVILLITDRTTTVEEDRKTERDPHNELGFRH
jgi:hypothetical protein